MVKNKTSNIFTISSDIRLRKEHFGGLVFSKKSGNTIDVDREAFILLLLIKQNEFMSKKELFTALAEINIKAKEHIVTKLIKEFVEQGIIIKNKVLGTEIKNRELDFKVETNWPSYQYLSAPETVHWAITYNCSQDCPDCYARVHKDKFKDLDTEDAVKVIDKIADWGAFQLAIGGGEALKRNDLTTITEYAHKKGLVVHITTGVDDIDSKLLNKLSESVTSLQLGIKHERLIKNGQEEFERLKSFVNKIRDYGFYLGANLMLSRTVIKNFNKVINYLARLNFSRIVLLRYKPPMNVSQWKKEKPAADDLLEFEEILAEVIGRYNLNLRVDCALNFLQRGMDTEEALSQGIRGCVAGKRIVALTPDASIFPCSQLIKPDLKAGNVLADSLDKVWKKSKTIKYYRYYKRKRKFKESACGICTASEYCGGCPVFSQTGKGIDSDCPQPLIVSSLKQIGKYGRRAGLKEHFKNNYLISVADYMEDYGVGQKRAVKELKGTSWLVKADKSSTGRKKRDCYCTVEEDAVAGIQESIGHTNGGFPYATREQIMESTKEDDDRSYPQWKKNSKY